MDALEEDSELREWSLFLAERASQISRQLDLISSAQQIVTGGSKPERLLGHQECSSGDCSPHPYAAIFDVSSGRRCSFKPSTAKGGRAYELQYMPTNLHVQQMRVCRLGPPGTLASAGGGAGATRATDSGADANDMDSGEVEVALYTSITVGAPAAQHCFSLYTIAQSFR